MSSPRFSPLRRRVWGGIDGRLMSALCGEMSVSDRDFTAVMPAVAASIPRWAAIGRRNRRVSGRAMDIPAAILGDRRG